MLRSTCMLSTPPAFILSQDQTLMFNVDPSSRSTSFFILVNYCSYKERSLILLKSSEKFIRIFKGCLIVQLSKIFLIRFLCVRSFIILSQFFLFVKNFFNLFCCSELFCSATTFISYHLSPCLSRSFLMIFIMYRSDRSPSVTFS